MSLELLKKRIVKCRLCPRLVKFRETLPKRASFQNETYLRKPAPGFGNPQAKLLILGLAPSAHGGNRTGRIFTGDESGRFLFQNLYQAGFASKPHSDHLEDGLKLKDCYITAAVKCVPPQNKPLSSECENCESYLLKEMEYLKKIKVVLTLGQLPFTRMTRLLKKKEGIKENFNFKHGAVFAFKSLTLFASYHPSPQNTYTGKLTDKMLISLLTKIRNKL